MKSTLQQLLEQNKFDYVNPDITDENFPPVPFAKDGFKLFYFDEPVSSEEAIKRMGDEYRPANIFELLSFAAKNPDEQCKFLIVGLGSVMERDGDRRVPCLLQDGGERDLRLRWWGFEWLGYYRFLAVKKSSPVSLEPSELEQPLDTLQPVKIKPRDLRDEFAMAVMAAAFNKYVESAGSTPEFLARIAYRYADAMMKVREK